MNFHFHKVEFMRIIEHELDKRIKGTQINVSRSDIALIIYEATMGVIQAHGKLTEPIPKLDGLFVDFIIEEVREFSKSGLKTKYDFKQAKATCQKLVFRSIDRVYAKNINPKTLQQNLFNS